MKKRISSHTLHSFDYEILLSKIQNDVNTYPNSVASQESLVLSLSLGIIKVHYHISWTLRKSKKKAIE
jgi:hypothetical protein